MLLEVLSAVLSSASAIWVIWLSTHEAKSKHHHFKGLTAVTLLTCILAIGALASNRQSQAEASRRISSMQDQLNHVGTMTDDVLGPSMSIQTFGLKKDANGATFVAAILHNGGQSTAQDVHGIVVLVATDPGRPKPDFARAYSEQEARGAGPIGKDQNELLRTAGSISVDVLNSKRAQGSSIYTLGSVWYEDDWHQRHELAFCYFLNQDNNFEVRRAHTCDDKI